jgi:predicted helicase
MTFRDILAKHRKAAFSERDKGDRFERLMQAYLLSTPEYAHRFKKVWLWNEFPGKKDFGGKDTGIDLVALTNQGDYWAIQCKCYQEDSVIDKASVDSFLSTSSREFKNEELRTVSFAHRLWISTTNRWGTNATQAIQNQNPPVSRINLTELIEAPVDWGKLDEGISGEASRTGKKELRPHQKEAVERSHEYFKQANRGKLIMACGTGKTYTALRIAENETNGKGLVLFMVPSIALLGQTLREWSADAAEPINAICICSDAEVTRKKSKNEDQDYFSVVDLALPASTDVKNILRQFEQVKRGGNDGMTVVFSTYQSIDVIAKAQKELLKNGVPEFDLIICDEAHRTTGVTVAGEDESAFTKVHDNELLRAKKRLYMTATPRLYSDDAKSRAAQADAVLCSMDDPKIYGEEIYRIGFGEAVENGLLTDYKVLILTLSDKDVPPEIQKMVANKESEINSDDATKLIGCINALSKQVLGDNGIIRTTDPEPMRRAVAFCQTISTSKKITGTFNATSGLYVDALPTEQQKEMVNLQSRHVDGAMAAPERDELLGWLKEGGSTPNDCRVLTNVRCLSEGVDVPSLDAVLFLSARNSQVDVVQSVGRVMRKAPGKNYGYIIIPVVVPSDVDADKALDDNERYRVVWTVLNALRAHDDRFNATVNKIELNKKRPDQILVGRPGYTFEDGRPVRGSDDAGPEMGRQIAMQFEKLQGVVFARMVEKVGDRRYWEQWAKNVAEIAERQTHRIARLVKEEGTHKKAFARFLSGLQKNINPSITEQEAVEMLSQHIITKPVFEALFEGYSFVRNNAISTAMQKMLDLLEEQSLEKDTETLQKFYESVRTRAGGIDNAEGKQRIIIELYDKFFKTAFPKMVEKLGIVYTPVEVVDFLIFSVDHILRKEFGRGLTDENVHILDPFTGTGTFIVRLIQSGLIEAKDMARKYRYELHANEIVLLAYYIAAVNVENAYHDVAPDEGDDGYVPFEGICLTDTFQLGESKAGEKLFSEMFPKNSERVERQQKAPLRVIMGNPPYSVGQKSANDNAQNQKYERLDARVEATYARSSKASSVKALYDPYIKAFRWSSDRLGQQGGVIAFVTNGAWLDGNAQDGFRKSLEKEFSSIYVFNLRGNQRTSGELSRKEGGKIFGSGSRTPIAITLLVRNPESKAEKATIHYHDIGDYLTREQKLQIIKTFGSSSSVPWKVLEPNEHGDWLSHRDEGFGSMIPIEPEKKYDTKAQAVFTTFSLGLGTNRDAWCYNSSSHALQRNIQETIDFYNQCRTNYQKSKGGSVDEFIITDSSKIVWTDTLRRDMSKNIEYRISDGRVSDAVYRPFFKQRAYVSQTLNNRVYQLPKLFPNNKLGNLVIDATGIGGSKDFGVLMTNCIPDLQVMFNGQCFPLYWYEEVKKSSATLFDGSIEGTEYVQRDGVSDWILGEAQKRYGPRVSKEDIFYYVYGFLHSPIYREKFSNDLKKMLPRLPLVESPSDFWKFSKAGRELAELHVNYEKVPPSEAVKVEGAEKLGFLDDERNANLFRVEQMRFPKKDRKDTIIYNSRITITDIPAEAYEYVVNGKSAIEWVMERYRVTIHKESGIKNDPNDWSAEVGNPRYILDLLLSVIEVSVRTMALVKSLPEVTFDQVGAPVSE